MNHQRVPEYVGQVERDSSGELWAVLYSEGQVLMREQVRSLRQGKRRVTDLVLAAADSSARTDSIARLRGSGVPTQPKSPAVEAIDRPAHANPSACPPAGPDHCSTTREPAGHQATPRYASLIAGSASSSGPGPDLTTSPVSRM